MDIFALFIYFLKNKVLFPATGHVNFSLLCKQHLICCLEIEIQCRLIYLAVSTYDSQTITWSYIKSSTAFYVLCIWRIHRHCSETVYFYSVYSSTNDDDLVPNPEEMKCYCLGVLLAGTLKAPRNIAWEPEKEKRQTKY